MKKIFIIALVLIILGIPALMFTGCSNNGRTFILTQGEQREIGGWFIRFNNINFTIRNATMHDVNFNITVTNLRAHSRNFTYGSRVYINYERHNMAIGGMSNQFLPFESRTGVLSTAVPIEDATFENEFIFQFRVNARDSGRHEYVRFVAGGNV